MPSFLVAIIELIESIQELKTGLVAIHTAAELVEEREGGRERGRKEKEGGREGGERKRVKGEGGREGGRREKEDKREGRENEGLIRSKVD